MSLIIGSTANSSKTALILPPGVVRSRSVQTISVTNQNNLTVTMPPTWVAGDRLVALVAKISTRVIDTAVSGVNWATEYTGDLTGVGLSILTKIAEGGDSDGLDALRLTSSVSGRWAARVYAIQNGTVIRRANAAPAPGLVNPPSLALPATAKGYVFLSGAALRGGAVSTAPSGYGNLLMSTGGGSGDGGRLVTADKTEVKGTSEDPGEFTPSVNTNNINFTLAFASS